jgi:hypothetical protein
MSAGARPPARSSVFATVIARVSPTATATVVEVIGAATPNDTISGSWMGAGSRKLLLELRPEKSGQVKIDGWSVSPIIGLARDIYCRRWRSSCVRPEKLTNRMMSFYPH